MVNSNTSKGNDLLLFTIGKYCGNRPMRLKKSEWDKKEKGEAKKRMKVRVCLSFFGNKFLNFSFKNNPFVGIRGCDKEDNWKVILVKNNKFESKSK